ncbi:MAG: methylenetetrahydrofolate--tRNA-(uracil(54)-C(5))-methyltransferase (FADH(2)-oxidizing) TrmFO [Candidatus Scatomorpha sp.]|jgi:methylenetetrahydrofolate--tRNA-(uracil-5-)-methyltransferase
MRQKVKVIGAGLAGCECAWQLAKRNIEVELFEMKPDKMSPAHNLESFAELVCSNSFRSDELGNAVGLLKAELRVLDSLIMEAADATKVPAGSALAVDREGFSEYVTEKIKSSPNIKIIHEEVKRIPDGRVVIAAGPLVSEALAKEIKDCTGDTGLFFFDAVAPLVSFESIDMGNAYFASRYDKGSPDYINCPLNKEEYLAFYNELLNAEMAELRDFEDSAVFEGCMPIESLAKRGEDTIRFGPLKPVGLTNPKTGKQDYAVIQLRRDNSEGSIYNMVGFQTHLKFNEQKRVFSMIPALKNADFLRYGRMHRNTYINSPGLLDAQYRLKKNKSISFAGQISGVEGYVESTASGMLAGLSICAEILGEEEINFPRKTAIGALASYISNESIVNFQPMNINFGIIESLDYRVKGKREKNLAVSRRALECIDEIKERKIFSENCS